MSLTVRPLTRMPPREAPYRTLPIVVRRSNDVAFAITKAMLRDRRN